MAIFRLCHVRQCNVLLCPAKFVFPQSRLISVKVQGKSKPTLPNLETKDHPTAKGKLKRRFFQRFFDYLSGYEKVLKSVLPDSAVKIIELFSSGTKLLFADMKEFAWTNHVLTSTTNWEKACNTLSRHQLELYLHLPSDLIRTAPVLLISALPFAQNVVFPLALMFPKQLLSSHFWSDKEWHEVQVSWQKSRQRYYLPTLKHIIKLGQAQKDSQDLLQTFQHLESGKQPTAEDILPFKPLFEPKGPLNLRALTAPYARYLLKLHGVGGIFWWWFPRHKLQQHANLIRQIDLAIIRENPDTLTDKSLASACYLRGLNANNLERTESDAFMRQWLAISSQLDANSLSLLLHLPVLLGINQKKQFWEFQTTKSSKEDH